MHIRLTSPKPREADEPPTTIGEHLRHVRLSRKLSQKEAAFIIGVDPGSVFNWEKGKTEPPVKFMPAVLRFLGYDPLPTPETLPERMFAYRRRHGLTIMEAATRLGVDPGTWGGWERGTTKLWPRYLALVERLLTFPEGEPVSIPEESVIPVS